METTNNMMTPKGGTKRNGEQCSFFLFFLVCLGILFRFFLTTWDQPSVSGLSMLTKRDQGTTHRQVYLLITEFQRQNFIICLPWTNCQRVEMMDERINSAVYVKVLK